MQKGSTQMSSVGDAFSTTFLHIIATTDRPPSGSDALNHLVGRRPSGRRSAGWDIMMGFYF